MSASITTTLNTRLRFRIVRHQTWRGTHAWYESKSEPHRLALPSELALWDEIIRLHGELARERHNRQREARGQRDA
jgi:hypothetical protein